MEKEKGEILEEREEKEERKENPEGEAYLLPSPTMTSFPDPRREIIVQHPRRRIGKLSWRPSVPSPRTKPRRGRVGKPRARRPRDVSGC